MPVFPIDQIAVIIDVDKIIVGADLLELPVCCKERAMIPQPHVLDREMVASDIRCRQVLLHRKELFLDISQAKRGAGEFNVMLNIGSLQGAFIRDHLKPMDEFGIETQAEGARKQGQGRQDHCWTPDPAQGKNQERHRGDDA